MYAEVYKFFTETSGRGLSQEVMKLMKPHQAKKESDVAEAIEAWEEHMNRLARHGKEYELPPVFKQEALKCILIGKIRDHFDLWVAEQMPFEQVLKKVKDQAMAAKLDTDVSQGRAGVAMGECPDSLKQLGRDQFPSGGEQGAADLNAFNGKGPGWGQQSKGKDKGKGKGKDQKGGKSKGKGKGGKAQQSQSVNAAGASPGFSGLSLIHI